MLNWIIALALLYLVLERIAPGVALPKVRGWWRRAAALNLAQLGVVLLAGVTWERWLGGWSIFSLPSSFGVLGSALTAYFISTFVFYWWHRARHESDFLWRVLHQIHHSAQRIEIVTAFYKHPLEMMLNSMISSALVYTVLGLGVEAAAIYMFLIAAGEFFYHANVKTPRWIGYFVQRPEMHRIHHQYGRHDSNYADIVWWDMLFGTYENPPGAECACGFDDAREQRLGEMLAFGDVHQGVDSPSR